MRLWEHPLAIVGAGVVLVVFGVYTRVQSLRGRSWPTAPESSPSRASTRAET